MDTALDGDVDVDDMDDEDDGGIFWYTQLRPLAAQRVHRGVLLSHRRLPLTQALQLFWRDAAAARSCLAALKLPAPLLSGLVKLSMVVPAYFSSFCQYKCPGFT
jgi:hypothetical protein